MKYKTGVSPLCLKVEMLFVLYIAERVFNKYGYGVVVTSTCEGVHRDNSYHYTGFAVDLRTRHVDEHSLLNIETDLKKQLMDESFHYQVILEDSHLHIEYDWRFNNEA